MGLFARLFKTQPGAGGEKAVGNSGGKKDALPAPDPGVFLQPKDFLPRLSAPVPLRSAAPMRPVALVDAPAAPPREIVLSLGDLLPRIPAQCLTDGAHDGRRAVRFLTAELSTDIARGRVTVPLSRIAAQCPEVFRAGLEDVEIRLPLQRLLDQLTGLDSMPSRPPPPVVETKRADEAVAAARETSPPVAATIAPMNERERPTPAPATPPLAAAEPPAVDWDAAPAAESGDERIHLSLAAILAGCPDEIFAGERPRVDDSVRLTFPFAPIERQLAGGRVEITAQRLAALLPPEYARSFQPRDGVKVPLPLEEIFQNLPGVPPPAPPPVPAAAEVPAPLQPPPVPLPQPAAAEPGPRAQFQFFSPAPPLLRAVAPPAIFGSAETTGATTTGAPGEKESHDEGGTAEAKREAVLESPISVETLAPVAPPAQLSAPAEAARPAGAPPLRTIEVRASPEAAPATPPVPKVLQSAEPLPALAPPPAGPTANLPVPPNVRPLMVLPPPISGTVAVAGGAGGAEPEVLLETTADQAAVLDFLSGNLNPAPPPSAGPVPPSE